MIKNEFINRLELSNKLYLDLVIHVPEELLGSKLADLLSNTVGQQLWCVVGARNSYINGVRAGQWTGFECPLDWNKTTNATEIKSAMNATLEKAVSVLNSIGELTQAQLKLLLDLTEHEAQHHGQLARYLYGLKIGVPQSWKDRYHFD